MEENNEEKSTGYTGEYGNAVEGDYQDNNESIYRYSYQDGENESTHSGDYYAGQDTQDTLKDEDTVTQNADSGQDGFQSGQGQYFNSDNTGYQNANTGSKDTGSQNGSFQNGYYQNSGYQNNSYQNGGYQNSGYQNNGYQNNAYRNGNYQNPNTGMPKNKKESSFGKKILLTAALAVMFGIVAGVCFNAVNYASEMLLGTSGRADDGVKIGKTTDQTAVPTANPNNNSGNTSSSQAVADVSSITEQCMPAIVAITSTTKGADYYDLFGQYYQGQDTTGSGSGFIVGQNKKELLIATNNHVIAKAKTISVQFIDGEIYEATEKGSDSGNDLAVIAVQLSDLKKSTMEKIKIADMGDSDKAKVGEMVIAIGNALGYGQSVTVGYISAKDREITETSSDSTSAGNRIKALQTDAAINPGNSGGALINMQGQVIGINSAKIANSAVEGVGYAIPISVATPIIDELMNREILNDDEKGYLGISGSTVTQEGMAYNLPYGVHVKEVAAGGAAEKAGIKVNDIITAVNKMEVTTMQSLQQKVNSYRKGTKIEVTVQRSSNGKYEEKKITVTLQGKDSLDSLPDDNSSSGSGNAGRGDSRDNENNNQPDNGNGDNSNNGGNFWDFFR